MTLPDQSDTTAEALIRQVGSHVRRLRTARGMTRKTLSEISQVSPRYLAQLEAGAGNISIALLSRVAEALDHPVAGFFETGDAGPLDTGDVARLFRSADTATRQEVLALLTRNQNLRKSGICLIGLRGAGKSTLGAAAGKALGLPFVELNAAIETAAGMPIAEIMALYGTEGYRDLEARALEDLIASGDPLILAAAGGVVSAPATYARLLERFHTIWLKAAPEEHMDRVRAQGDMRPMAGNPQAMSQLKTILTNRDRQYARAEAVLDTSGVTADVSLAQLLALITKAGLING